MTGVQAEGSGFGNTECGVTVRQQRTGNMTIKENSECAEIIGKEFKRHLINEARIKTVLSRGFNDQILCTAGKFIEAAGGVSVRTISQFVGNHGDNPICSFSGTMQRRQRGCSVCVPSKSSRRQANARQ